MTVKIAFVYAHGGPVFDSAKGDRLNERGANLVKSIMSALDSGGEKVFISESVYPEKKSEVEDLIRKGFFGGFARRLDVGVYPIDKNVKFPKNYLMNRGAQRADGFSGLIFSDSDVLFSDKFAERVSHGLNSHEFLQPEKIMYLNPDGSDNVHAVVESTMKRIKLITGYLKDTLWYLEGMPGMVNIANRNKFLEIGGFSQAISGVNFEDIEYILRLRILDEKFGHLSNEICRHLYHSRSLVTRKSEKLIGMYFENANFMNWFIDEYLKIQGTEYDKDEFDSYMRIIKMSLNANNKLRGSYKNETGTITTEFDKSKVYHGIYFGTEEPYVEWGTKEEKILAIKNAADFWRISCEEVMQRNPEWKYSGITINDVKKFKSEEGLPKIQEDTKMYKAKSVEIDEKIIQILDEYEDQMDMVISRRIDDILDEHDSMIEQVIEKVLNDEA